VLSENSQVYTVNFQKGYPWNARGLKRDKPAAGLQAYSKSNN
jgi:hypothetical protein